MFNLTFFTLTERGVEWVCSYMWSTVRNAFVIPDLDCFGASRFM